MPNSAQPPAAPPAPAAGPPAGPPHTPPISTTMATATTAAFRSGAVRSGTVTLHRASATTPGSTPSTTPTTTIDPQVVSLLDRHRANLAAAGVTDLSARQKLTFSGRYTPSPGVTAGAPISSSTGGNPPGGGNNNPPGSVVSFSGALTVSYNPTQVLNNPTAPYQDIGANFQLMTGTAVKVNATPLFGAASTGRMRFADSGGHSPTDAQWLHVAYWAASEIDIEDNTVILLTPECPYFVLIALKLNIGLNVQFTTVDTAPLVGGLQVFPNAAGKCPNGTTRFNWGDRSAPPTGATGDDGLAGAPGATGADGPAVELWFGATQGFPSSFALSGYSGGAGANGQPGGCGEDGAAGAPAVADMDPTGSFAVSCSKGPGAGGNGAPGGRGGDGGQGGSGGAPGSLDVYAPSTITSQLTYATTMRAGESGPGGLGAPGGRGGAAGPLGTNSYPFCSAEGRTAGSAGANGASGANGTTPARSTATGSAASHAITQDLLVQKLTQPAIAAIAVGAQPSGPSAAIRYGDQLTLSGANYRAGDIVELTILDGNHNPASTLPCITTAISDTQCRATVPQTLGGSGYLQVKRNDGTLSNKLGIAYVASISDIDNNPTSSASFSMLTPGRVSYVHGAGFSQGSTVFLNEQACPTTFHSFHELEFTVVRPPSVAVTLLGPSFDESATLTVKGAVAGQDSSGVTVGIETFLIAAIGDSVVWGQGLATEHKFPELVADHIAQVKSGWGVHVAHIAHSGAIIGLMPTPDNTRPTPQKPFPSSQEVPFPCPTVAQQVNDFADAAAARVRLVLLNGGANDVGIENVANPLQSMDDIVTNIDTHCHKGMSKLLALAMAKFPRAQIIVTGYYQALSSDSDVDLFLPYVSMLLGAFAALEGPAGAIAYLGNLGPVAAREVIAPRTARFSTETAKALKAAVDEANATGREPQVQLAIANIPPRDATLAPTAALFGINQDFSLQDEVAASRKSACNAYEKAINLSSPNLDSDAGLCTIASLGHPNQRGSSAYVDAIVPLLVLN